MAIGDNITEPPCPLYGLCGGCSLQHMSYDAQLDVKKSILIEALSRENSLDAAQEAVLKGCTVVPSSPWEYRNRVSFHTIKANKGPKAGFMERKSGKIIPVSDCPVADPGIRALLQAGRAITPPVDKDRFTVYSYKETLLVEGQNNRGKVRILDKELSMDEGCFFQSNAALLEKLLLRLRGIASDAADTYRAGAGSDADGPGMADLYAGVGTFSAFLAEYFTAADLLEQNKTALDIARYNLGSGRQGADGHQGTDGRFRFFAQTDNVWARNKGRTKTAPGSYTFAVADPPRQGLSRSMAQWLAESGPRVLSYVSCAPSSLARDCRILLGSGSYVLEEIILYDFYPQTAHIESLAVFKRRKTV